MQKKKYVYLALALLFILSIFGSLQAINFFKPSNPAQAASPGDWTTYLNNPGHTGYNGFETAINPSTAGSLKQLWSISEGSILSTQPVVANGLIYWGSWDGIEHATHLDGTQAWATNLGTAPTNCPNPGSPASQGILSTATIATVTINGTPTTVDLVGSASDFFYALNASTGAVIWKTALGTPANEVIWASPTFYNGSVYVGVASNDCPLIQGKEFQLNASTGTIQNTFNAAPNGCTGAGIPGSAAIDTSNGTLYFATGNGNICSLPGEYGQTVIKLNASNLSLMSSWQIPQAQLGGNTDPDFISSPTLFTATIGGTIHRMVGIANKDGSYYAFDETTLGSGPVWQTQVANNGECPECGAGSISPSAWDGSTLYVAGGNTTINAQSCQGGLRALNPATGAVIWAQCMPDGPVLGAVSAVPGVVAVTEGNALWLMASSDGHSLFKAVNTTKNPYYAAPTISNGVVYAANSNGNFSAYGLGSNTNPPPSPTPTLPPVSGPVSKTWYFAEGRAGAGFDEFLTLGNPTSSNCQVSITYMTQPDRGPGTTKTVSVAVNASTRVTRWVDSDLGTTRAGPGISVAATVSVDTTATPTCTGIVAERPMYFNARLQGTNSGSDVLGVTSPGTTFYFADLASGNQPGGGFYSSYLPILNPGTTAATVTATYYASGRSVGTQTLTVAAGSRGTIFPSQASPALPAHVSVVLTSSAPIVSERPTYFSGINGGNAGVVSGAADVIGVQQLSTDWLFAEGYTGGRFQENFVLANLDPAAQPATVTITLEYNGGVTKPFTVTVNPLSQLIWNVNANSVGAGTSQSVSAEITSTGAQIVAEREMFFGYSHQGNGRSMGATGGTDVLGQVGPAAKSDYSFAEGYTNGGYDEWLTIQNPTATTETVNVTVSNAVGTVYTYAVQVVGHSRATVDMVAIVMQHMYRAGNGYNGYEVSMAVQSSSPFVVERPMYWNASGTTGGSDVIGYTGG